jgi:hypothetical protein
MPLSRYAEVVALSESIREAVRANRMPPWHADPKYGKWANDRSLSAGERRTLLAWLDAGCPQGRPVAAAPPNEDGWRIKPDVVIECPEQAVPASGLVSYRYVEAPTGFQTDVWVTAAEVRPGNRKVVHHCLVFAGEVGFAGAMVASYLPGDEPLQLPAGYAKRIAAGCPLLFQLHYTATGRRERDRTAIGLVFAKEPPAKEVRTMKVEQLEFTIPAGAANYRIESTWVTAHPLELLTFTPHMHLRGKDFKYGVTYPDGKQETLLSVPRYDFNWQTGYRSAAPLEIPAGSRIDCVAHFDNSAGNPANPDPTRQVSQGESTDQEMMIGFVDYAVPRGLLKPFMPTPNLIRVRRKVPLWQWPEFWAVAATPFVAVGLVLRSRRWRRAKAMESENSTRCRGVRHGGDERPAVR